MPFSVPSKDPRDVQYGVPDVADRGIGSSPRAQILVLIGGAALIRFAAGMGVYEKDGNMVRPGLAGVPIIAFIAIYVALAMAADFDATRDLAVIFSLLLFVTILINSGIKASKNLSSLVSHKVTFKSKQIRTQ
jgi:hypothetical protein